MNKSLLLIPFMALLATSCSGGHITTTPVANTPKAGVLTATKRQALQAEEGRKVAYVNLGTLGWTKTNGSAPENIYFYSDVVDGIIQTTNTETASLACSEFRTVPHDNNYKRPAGAPLGISVSGKRICLADYTFDNMSVEQFKNQIDGLGCYYRTTADYTGEGAKDYWKGLGRDEGFEDGYLYGYQEGEAYNNQIIKNGQYAGLTAYPRRHYLEALAKRVVSGSEQLQEGHFDLIDTNANYTIYIKWNYSYPKTTFQDYGNTIIGELDWPKIVSGDWSTSWFGKYDPELHQILNTKYYATDAPITMSLYPEVYLGSTIVGDVDLYFMGTANDYRLGFADGQTYTIKASETYQNIFTIFTPAFKAVADFFNLNIGPFKVWYFFAIPLIITLLILVLRLVKH